MANRVKSCDYTELTACEGGGGRKSIEYCLGVNKVNFIVTLPKSSDPSPRGADDKEEPAI